MSSINKLIELYNLLDNYKYGYKNLSDDISPEIFSTNYRTVNMRDFEKYKKGVCWDYANYEYNSPITKDIQKKAYYIELDDKSNTTHTFVVYKIDNNYYYFERSYYKIRGIYKSKNVSSIFNLILSNMMDGKKYNYEIREYKPSSEYIGLSCIEFMDKCLEQKHVRYTYENQNYDDIEKII